MNSVIGGLGSSLLIRFAAPQHDLGWHTEIRQDLRQIQAAHTGQLYVGDDHIGRRIPNLPQGIVGCIEHMHVDIIGQLVLQRAQRLVIAWYNQDSVGHGCFSPFPAYNSCPLLLVACSCRKGNATVNVLPSPSRLRNQSAPPSAPTNSRTNASPSPVPPWSRVSESATW